MGDELEERGQEGPERGQGDVNDKQPHEPHHPDQQGVLSLHQQPAPKRGQGIPGKIPKAAEETPYGHRAPPFHDPP